ncbi:TetR/AcrR family transcriptional regulator [Pseudonocardia sp. GCM10023141]|uniref:TetR/AcrR family transcriptional regulator n=1 Tax=Pseudonocardia sp. GCM10023141 TaxID=3252653 RepID=UPI003617EAB3
MQPVQDGKPVRRTQEQRSAAMRRRILDATVRCLQEDGYAGTTTVRVVERAGVTRGALAHHFASKADMVAAAVSHIAATRTAELLPRLEAARAAADPVDAGLELLWSVHQGPLFAAVVELWVAARTDPELQRKVVLVEQETNATIVEYARTLFGPGGQRTAVRHAVFTAMDTVRGLLLTRVALPPEEPEARWRRAKADLRVVFDHALARGQGPA